MNKGNELLNSFRGISSSVNTMSDTLLTVLKGTEKAITKGNEFLRSIEEVAYSVKQGIDLSNDLRSKVNSTYMDMSEQLTVQNNNIVGNSNQQQTYQQPPYMQGQVPQQPNQNMYSNNTYNNLNTVESTISPNKRNKDKIVETLAKSGIKVIFTNDNHKHNLIPVFTFNNLQVAIDNNAENMYLLLSVEDAILDMLTVNEVNIVTGLLPSVYKYFNYIHKKFNMDWVRVDTASYGTFHIKYINCCRPNLSPDEENNRCPFPAKDNDLHVLFQSDKGTIYSLPYGLIIYVMSAMNHVSNGTTISATYAGIDFKIARVVEYGEQVYRFAYEYEGLTYDFVLPLSKLIKGDNLLSEVVLSPDSIIKYKKDINGVTWNSISMYLRSRKNINMYNDILKVLDKVLYLGMNETELRAL